MSRKAGAHSSGHREKPRVFAGTRLSCFQGKCGLLPGHGAAPRSWMVLANADVLIGRFLVLTEDQVPFLTVSVTAVLALISEVLLKWPGTLFIVSWKDRVSVEKTC